MSYASLVAAQKPIRIEHPCPSCSEGSCECDSVCYATSLTARISAKDGTGLAGTDPSGWPLLTIGIIFPCLRRKGIKTCFYGWWHGWGCVCRVSFQHARAFWKVLSVCPSVMGRLLSLLRSSSVCVRLHALTARKPTCNKACANGITSVGLFYTIPSPLMPRTPIQVFCLLATMKTMAVKLSVTGSSGSVGVSLASLCLLCVIHFSVFCLMMWWLPKLCGLWISCVARIVVCMSFPHLSGCLVACRVIRLSCLWVPSAVREYPSPGKRFW